MNPDNNALERTYFIGGPPRVGKSILACAFAEKIHGNVVSTDSIRDAVKKACTDKDSDLFAVNAVQDMPEEEWVRVHKETPEVIVAYQNRESEALWPSLVAFCNNFCEDEMNHIIEGIGILPKLVAGMQHRPKHVVFVGNTSTEHLYAMMDYAKKFPEKDWMSAMQYSEERFKGMAHYIREMSLYLRNEANTHGFAYHEISDAHFEESIQEIIRAIIIQSSDD
ncbi:MAG: hypothetical protein CUN55_15440 [Phototrophicales bacterium]|nr:MAG: hypothetical protein CUN55_15440 [Phototrophicales bacterium]